jgi:DNA repair photolyase
MTSLGGNRGSGADDAHIGNPGLRWRLASDDAGTLFSADELVERHVGVGEYRSMEFLHVNARHVINEVPAASKLPFRFTINAYRGCSHACVYCFARPTHEYLGLNLAEDFERRIVVKVNAVERLEADLRSPKWKGDHIAMGTNTDPYQKAEAKYHLTRGIVEVLGRHENPFSILTKSTLVLRDLDVLLRAAQRANVHMAFSIGTLDKQVWRLTEPGTPPPDKRVEAVRRLNQAGIPCSVLIAPVLPGFSDGDDQLTEVAQACAAAGATSISPIALHLRPGVREHYLGWLASQRPDLVALHRARFHGRAYQEESEQRRIRRVVDAALGRASAGTSRETGPHTKNAARFTTGHESASADARRRTRSPVAIALVPQKERDDAQVVQPSLF